MRTDVAALYIDPKGPYPALVRDWYDEARDAKTYAGPWPVVAHPPCGPWGRLSPFCTKQDPEAALHGVEMVRRWGGVLEHPAQSRLFRHCMLPWPCELPDTFGGSTYAVRQVAWGHRCEKPTWLYVVGAPSAVVVAGLRTGGVASRQIKRTRHGAALPDVPKSERHITPIAFAEWLLELAASARVADGRAA